MFGFDLGPVYLLGAVALVMLVAAGLFLAFGGATAAWVVARLPFASNTAKLKRSVSLAMKSLWLHKLRSVLSVLGIIIGTCSVISLMSFGEGSMQDALDDIKRQGATNIIVRSVKPPDDSSTANRSFVTGYGLTQKDLVKFSTFGDAITRTVPEKSGMSKVTAETLPPAAAYIHGSSDVSRPFTPWIPTASRWSAAPTKVETSSSLRS